MICYWSRSSLLCHDHNDGCVVNSRVVSVCCFVVGFSLLFTGPSFLEKEDLGDFKVYDKGVCFTCLPHVLNLNLA